MAKHKKVLPARRSQERLADDESILLRSAETVGRVIGTLQRQLDGAYGRLSGFALDPQAASKTRNGATPNGNAETRKVSVAAKPKGAGQSKAARATMTRARKTAKAAKRSPKSR